MLKTCKRIGISGGTFDPVHMGHLIVAETVREVFNLDRILFIPSGTPPHKLNIKVSDAENRYKMLEKAISSNKFFESSRIEIDRVGNSYSIDTIKQLKELHKEEVELYFIIGADVLPELVTWREYENLFKMCNFIAVPRPNYDRNDFIKEIEFLKTQYMAKIIIVDVPLIDISSTKIRERVKMGESIKYLVPDKVESHINENRLYSD